MSKKKKLPIDYMEETNPTVSARECTGLTPRGIKTDAETEAYNELYNVEVPDSDLTEKKKTKKK